MHTLYFGLHGVKKYKFTANISKPEIFPNNSYFWFLLKTRRFAKCWVCILMQQQLASREKELLALEGPLVPGYQRFGGLSSTDSERLPAPICEL